jgi:hypothetical protein
LGNGRFEGLTLTRWASLERAAGDFEAMAGCLERAGPILKEAGERFALGYWTCEHERLALARGEPAATWLDEASALAESVGAGAESELASTVAELRGDRGGSGRRSRVVGWTASPRQPPFGVDSSGAHARN